MCIRDSFVGYVPVLLFCLSRKIALPSAVQSALEAVGNMTYSSYLLHFPLQLGFVLCFALAGRAVPIYSGALFTAYLMTVLLLSYVTFRFFEAPAQHFLRAALREAQKPASLKQASSA